MALSNLFNLQAILSLDKSDYDKGLDDAEGKANGFGDKLMKGLGNGAKIIGAASVAATGAAITGVTALTTASVNAYGNYEQLAGGIEKLYGESANTLIGYAGQAYETAGMSANAYMQSVTGFSAALLNSVGGDSQRAAEIADMAMRDLSDNANTFGVQTTEELANVYSALARGSFQTLDSLNLGFAGTQEGMIDLINASGIFEEQITSLDNVSFDQMLMAIHAVQENMNIAGTTANEASGTIQGSLGSLQASWTNLITGLGNGSADLGKLIDDVVKSATNVVKNIRPIATQAVRGIADLVTELAPVIATELPAIINEILPDLLSAVTGLINTVMEVLPTLVETLLPVVLEVALTIVDALAGFLQSDSALQIIMSIVDGLIEALPSLIEASTAIIVQLANNLSSPDNMSKLIETALKLILAIASGIVQAIPQLIAVIPQVIGALIGQIILDFPQILETIGELIGALGALVLESLASLMGTSLEDVASGLSVIGDAISSAFDGIFGFFSDLGSNIVSGVTDMWDTITGLFDGGLGDIFSGVSGGLGDVFGVFGDVFGDIKDVVTDGIDWILDKFDFDWSFPHINLPHFHVSGGKAPWGFGGHGHLPDVSVEWYEKAYREPIMLSSPTIFGMSGDKLLGGGEGKGSEMIYGKDALMQDIKNAVASVSGGNQQIIIPVYIGDEKLDELVVNSMQRNDFVSGGR